jgi:hypothetical protein
LTGDFATVFFAVVAFLTTGFFAGADFFTAADFFAGADFFVGDAFLAAAAFAPPALLTDRLLAAAFPGAAFFAAVERTVATVERRAAVRAADTALGAEPDVPRAAVESSRGTVDLPSP